MSLFPFLICKRKQVSPMDIRGDAHDKSFNQEIREGQFAPKAFPDRERISTTPVTNFEELEQILDEL